MLQVVVESWSQAVGVPVQADVLLQLQLELATQAVADLKVAQDVGVPLQLEAEVHSQFGLDAHVLLVANVVHAVGVPVQVPPDGAADQLQLSELPQPTLSVNVGQAVVVPLHSEAVESQTHPASSPHAASLSAASVVFASAQAKVSVCWQVPVEPVELVNLHPGSRLHPDCVPSSTDAHDKAESV